MLTNLQQWRRQALVKLRYRRGKILAGLIACSSPVAGEACVSTVVLFDKQTVGGTTTDWGWPTWSVFVAEWLAAGLAVMVGSYTVAYFVIRAFRSAGHRAGATSNDVVAHHRKTLPPWAHALLRRGAGLAYVVLSVVFGAPGIALWYCQRRHPRVHGRALGAAAIAGAVMSAFWLGAFTSQYRPWLLVGLCLTALAILAHHRVKSWVRSSD